jgi:hypothetical protein
MVVIFIAIGPAELQPLREFRSEADFDPPLRGNCLLKNFREMSKESGKNG